MRYSSSLASPPGPRPPTRISVCGTIRPDPCHGHQQMALLNGFYDQYMYLPNLVFERDGEPGTWRGVRCAD